MHILHTIFLKDGAGNIGKTKKSSQDNDENETSTLKNYVKYEILYVAYDGR